MLFVAIIAAEINERLDWYNKYEFLDVACDIGAQKTVAGFGCAQAYYKRTDVHFRLLSGTSVLLSMTCYVIVML